MPELPEVQTVVKTLQSQIDQKTIQDVIVKTPNIIQQDVITFQQLLRNKKITRFDRRGKYIILYLSSGYLVIHLRMEGRFFISDNIVEHKHVHVIFLLSEHKVLHYQDTRKFGRMKYLNDNQQLIAYLSHLGLEYTDNNFNGVYLYNNAKNSTRSLKSLLLSQHLIAGIGNIYADEICFYGKLHPATPCNGVSKKSWEKIAEGIKVILDEAIECGGSSIRSYTDTLGISGRFQLQLKVHMRKDQACFVCSTNIIKTKVANRGTYICPACQKLKK